MSKPQKIKKRTTKKKASGSKSIMRPILASVFVVGLGTAGLVGLQVLPNKAMAAEKSYSKAQAAKDMQVVVDRFTITEFCGQDSWSVRKGYEVTRKQFLENKLITVKQFRNMRLKAIDKAEKYLAATGPADFNRWCDKNSEEATQFFLGLISGRKTSFETTYKFD